MHMLVGKRQQCDVASPFDRGGQSSLVLGAGSRFPAPFDLAALGQESTQHVCLLVVDEIDLVHTEHTHFSPVKTAPPASASATRAESPAALPIPISVTIPIAITVAGRWPAIPLR